VRQTARLATYLTTALVLAIGATVPASALTSVNVLAVRSVSRLVVNTSSVEAPAQVSADISMTTSACTPSLAGCQGTQYHPCSNRSDEFYSECAGDSGYAKVIPAGGDISHGIQWLNRGEKNALLNTQWANKINAVRLEVYAQDSANAYGHVAISVTGFTTVLETDPNGVRSAGLGMIDLPNLGDGASGTVSGTITNLASTQVAHWHFFADHPTTTHYTGSGKFVEGGFATAAATGAGALPVTWSTRPTWFGAYHFSVSTTQGAITTATWVCASPADGKANITIDGPETMSLDFSQPTLGRADCVRKS
jgi:hypothetical protein